MKAFWSTLAWMVLLTAGSEAVLRAQQPLRPTRERPAIPVDTLKLGEPAPDFVLKDVDGKQAVKLSDLKGKPVVLIFGSCTCPPFVASTKATDKLYAQYKDKAHFYVVYIREAHRTDGWVIAGNQFTVASPKSVEERQSIARAFVQKLDVSIPVLVDTIDDKTVQAYACWPNRMCIVDAQGRLADKGFAGPSGVSTSARRAAAVLDGLLVPSN